MQHVVLFQPSQDGWGPRRPDGGSPVQSQERRDNAGGVIAGQGAGCLACSSRWRARSGLGGSGGGSQTPNVAIRLRGVLVMARYAQASGLSSCSFAPIACWFRPRREWAPASTILCCGFALAERFPTRPWARQWSECSPRWLLSRPLVGAPTGILGHGLARPRRRGRAMRAWSRRAFPSQRLQRSRRADLGDRNGVGHGASTLTSAWPGQASQTALTERRCLRACSRSPTGNESNQGQRQRVSRSGA